MAPRFDCGYEVDLWVQDALEYLPDDVRQDWLDRLAFVCTSRSDARRLTRAFRKGREIIILSEHIIPRPHSDEGSSDFRYFVFCVLHEVVHVVNNDRAPDEISEEENRRQEQRADTVAREWFNRHIARRNVPTLSPLTPEEIRESQERTRAIMLSTLTD